MFGSTLREPHPGARTAAQALLSRAGFIRGTALFAWLPVARGTLERVNALLRDALTAAGAQEVILPRTGLAGGAGSVDVRELLRSDLRSWRQLPVVLAQTVTTPCPRAEALLVARDGEELAAGMEALAGACRGLFAACSADATESRIAGPVSGGPSTRLFLARHEEGGADVAACSCGWAAPWPLVELPEPPASTETPREQRRVSTPECTTIDSLCAFLGVERSRTAKAVMLTALLPRRDGTEERFVFAVVRGDRELSAEKLAAAIGADGLRPASEEEIRAAAAVPGYASPVGIAPGTLVVADPSVTRSANLVAGANETGFHLVDVNVPRDFTPGLVRDIAAARDGDPCPRCGLPLSTGRATTIAALAERVLPPAAAPRFQDAAGKETLARVATLTVDLGALVERIADRHRDGRGLVWPAAVAPFDAHLVCLGGAGSAELVAAERLCAEMEALGVSVLFDDREESAGAKFTDADLIGAPLRVTVSRRGMAAGTVELKARDSEEKTALPLAEAAGAVALAVARVRPRTLGPRL